MKITVTGSIEGTPVRATWEDGSLTGDESYVTELRTMVSVGTDVSLAGLRGGPASLAGDDPVMALATMLEPLDDGTGRIDAPELRPEPVPDGAVA